MAAIMKFLKWYVIIGVIAGGIYGVFFSSGSNADKTNVTAILADNARFERELKSAVDNQKGDTILGFYNNSKDSAQKTKIVEATIAGYIKWLATIKEKDQFSIALNKELQDYYHALDFVEKMNDPGLGDLLVVRQSIGDIMSKSEEWDKDRTTFSKNAQFVDNPEKVQWLEAYVASRVASALNLAIGNIKLTENYTDQYLVKSYRNVMNTAVSTDEWEAVVTFKKETPVKQGVMKILALQVGENKYEKAGGFQVTLPVYIEVNSEDVDYSHKLKAHRLNKKNNVDKISKIVEKHLAKGNNKDRSSVSNDSAMSKLYGTWFMNGPSMAESGHIAITEREVVRIPLRDVDSIPKNKWKRNAYTVSSININASTGEGYAILQFDDGSMNRFTLQSADSMTWDKAKHTWKKQSDNVNY